MSVRHRNCVITRHVPARIFIIPRPGAMRSNAAAKLRLMCCSMSGLRINTPGCGPTLHLSFRGIARGRGRRHARATMPPFGTRNTPNFLEIGDRDGCGRATSVDTRQIFLRLTTVCFDKVFKKLDVVFVTSTRVRPGSQTL